MITYISQQIPLIFFFFNETILFMNILSVDIDAFKMIVVGWLIEGATVEHHYNLIRCNMILQALLQWSMRNITPNLNTQKRTGELWGAFCKAFGEI